jgi:pilus assembly protein TadC
MLVIITLAGIVLVLGAIWDWQQRRDAAIAEQENALLSGLLESEDEDDEQERAKSKIPSPIEEVALRLRRSGLLSGANREDLLAALDRKLVHAGINNPVETTTPRPATDVLSYYLLWAGFIVISALAGLLFHVLPPIIVIGWAAGMLWFPWKLLNARIAKRQKAALFQMDKFLDELDLVLSNGRTTLDDALGSTIAYQRYSKRRDPILAREFDYAMRQWTAGRDRSEALRDVAKRIGVFQITAVVENMVQSLEKGTPPRESVRSQSDQAKAMVTEALRNRIGAADTAFTASMAMSLLGVTVILFGALVMGITSGVGGIV